MRLFNIFCLRQYSLGEYCVNFTICMISIQVSVDLSGAGDASQLDLQM